MSNITISFTAERDGKTLVTINRALRDQDLPAAERPSGRSPSASAVKAGVAVPDLDADALSRGLGPLVDPGSITPDGRLMGVVPGRDGRPVLTAAAVERAGPRSVADAGRTPGGPTISRSTADAFGASVARRLSTPRSELGPSGL